MTVHLSDRNSGPPLSATAAARRQTLPRRSERGCVTGVAILALWLGGSLAGIGPAAAETFTVTNAAGDGRLGSLRLAIEDANVAGPGPHSIVFDPVVFGSPRRIELSGTLTPVASEVTIDGPGAQLLTIAGDGQSRIMEVLEGGQLALKGVTLTNGNAGSEGGGAILSRGVLRIERCHITANRAAFGGGIFTGPGNLAVQFSTISDNVATGSATGGGIDGEAGVFVTRSTISGNRVLGTGGDSGGGLRLGSGSDAIEHSTITNNAAAGANDAGGLLLAGTVNLRNTIIAGNLEPDVAETPGGRAFSQGFNLIGNPGAVAFGGPGDQSGVTGAPLDPLLAPLASNGGGTPTHFLLPGSPALDRGAALDASSDQRGRRRPFDATGVVGPGDQSDIGAVEMQLLVVDNANDDGAGSLRQALRDANADPAPSDVVFDPAVFRARRTRAIDLQSVLPDITTSMTIAGPGADRVTVRRAAGGDYRVFTIPVPGLDVVIRGLTIRDGKAVNSPISLPTAGGGGILSISPLTLAGCAVVDNETAADLTGGGIVLVNTVGIFSDCTVSGNHGSFSVGGGVFLRNASAVFTGCTISGNVARAGGGGIAFDAGGGGSLRLVNSTVSDNRASIQGVGGGVFMQGLGGVTALEIINTTITNNQGIAGGGLHVGASVDGACPEAILRNSIIARNTAPNLQTSVVGGGDSSATITSLGHNLTDDDASFLNQPSDLTETDPRLGPLQNNGGETATHMPLGGSPALDRGNSGSIASDQRGRPRRYDVAGIPTAAGGDDSDMGAVEAQALLVTNADDSGAGSLRQVIADAPADSDILFDADFFGPMRTIGLSSGEIQFTQPVTVNGPGADRLVLSGLDANRIFFVGDRASHVAISGLTITDGRTGFLGGGIRADADLTLSECVIADSVAGGGGSGAARGGGVFVDAARGTFTNCTFAGNSAELAGGGVAVFDTGRGTFTGCTFSRNEANGRGGAIDLDDSSGTVVNSTISNNTSGGGIALVTTIGEQTLTVTSATIVQNDAGPGGAGIDISAIFGAMARATLRNSIVSDNFPADLAASTDAIGQVLITSLGYNLSEGDSTFLDHPTDVIGLDPLLGPLQNNGGFTATRVPLPGSPVIDQGTSTGAPIDQRGRTRPINDLELADADGGDGSDIGAVEADLPGACAGDCDRNGVVAINELVLLVNIALGNSPASACSAGDTNRDGRISINELIAAVNSALRNCTG